ncbi:hypothetical protein RLOC_00000711 [Lonchura striata]|uniref:Uncharacterized protein n=1 Tax=Lonchura striata TaxID=40157 RepID=A0A218UC12_9PASE|nr:hypothetical protein RLOC_00000711 [Lonchura striata domestica]
MEKNRLLLGVSSRQLGWECPWGAEAPRAPLQACPAPAVPGAAEGAGAAGRGGRAPHHAQPPHQGPAPHPEAGGPGAPGPAPDRAAAAGAAAPAAAAGEAGNGAGQDRQHRLQPRLRALRVGPRGDGRGRGEHGRPPGRPGLEQQQPQRLGRARQPAEPGQRRGLLQLRRDQGQAGRQQEASRPRDLGSAARRPRGSR